MKYTFAERVRAAGAGFYTSLTKAMPPEPQAASRVLVFGSNLQGIHGAGAALIAREEWGAVQGIGVGKTGRCYAIPTKLTPWRTIGLGGVRVYVEGFNRWLNHCVTPDVDVIISAIGCGRAGYTNEEIAPLFAPCNPLAIYPYEWLAVMNNLPQRVHKFHDSLVIGGLGEAMVKLTLQNKGVRVKDVAGVKEYQEQDIDFLIEGGRWKTVEVKTDQYRDNFFIETISNTATGRLGWLWGSRADVIAYCFTNLGVTYWLPLDALQNVFSNNIPAWNAYKKEVKNRDTWNPITKDSQHPDYYRTTLGYAVPINALLPAMHEESGAVYCTKNPEVLPGKLSFVPTAPGDIRAMSRKVA